MGCFSFFLFFFSTILLYSFLFFRLILFLSVLFSLLFPTQDFLSLFATQVFSLEKVCRCTIYCNQTLFRVATHVISCKMVCRCIVLLPFLPSPAAIQGIPLKSVCRCTDLLFRCFPISRYRFFAQKMCVATQMYAFVM